VAVAGRVSYTGLLFSLLSPDIVLTYWDYQLRLEHRLGSGRLTLFAFGSGDVLRGKGDTALFGTPGMIGPSDQPTRAELTFHRVDLRWDGRLWGGRAEVSDVVGRDSSDTSIQQLVSLPVSVIMVSTAPRLYYGHALAWWADIETGADGELQRFRPQSVLPGVAMHQDLFRDRDVLSAGAFVGVTLRTRSRFSLSPAVRAELFSEQGTRKVEPTPRVLARFRLTSDLWLKASAGRSAQMASLPVEVPGFEGFGLKSYGTQTSLQTAAGVEGRVGDVVTFEATGFYQRLRLTDLESIFRYDAEQANVIELRDGESYGVELLLRRSLTKRLYGWLAYTLSRSDRLIGYYRIKAPSDWDQRHILNLVLGYRLHGGWTASTRVHYNTGRPYPVSDERTFHVDYQRLPPFFQLDVRLDRQFVFDRFLMAVYIELVNTTLSREVYDIKLRDDGTPIESGFRIVLPSVGLHADW
jgi:hypothetical protein